MSMKECPACAMEIDDKAKDCPICGYEFSESNKGSVIIALILLILAAIYLIF